MTNEEGQSKMEDILKKHGLEYPHLGEEWSTAWPKLIAAFEFFDAEIKRLEEMTTSNFKEAIDYLVERTNSMSETSLQHPSPDAQAPQS